MAQSMPKPVVIENTVAVTASSSRARIMAVPLCLCGTPLVTDIEAGLWVCEHCGRAFCRDCGGMMTRVGGCDTCTVCGMGMCG